MPRSRQIDWLPLVVDMAKKLLFVTRTAPYGNSLAREALDAVLASSAYGQELGYLFQGDGVYQLLQEQKAEAIYSKSFSATLPALAIYDINDLYVCEESLKSRGLTIKDLSVQVKLLSTKEISSLLDSQNQIFSF